MIDFFKLEGRYLAITIVTICIATIIALCSIITIQTNNANAKQNALIKKEMEARQSRTVEVDSFTRTFNLANGMEKTLKFVITNEKDTTTVEVQYE